MARRDGGKMSTMVWFSESENEERKRLGVTHYQLWLMGLRTYQRMGKDGAKVGDINIEVKSTPDVPPCTAVLSLGPDGLKIETEA